MPRQPRLDISGLIHHVMMGNEKSSMDRRSFLKTAAATALAASLAPQRLAAG